MSVLSDTTIRTLMREGKLILNGNETHAKHCAYEFKAARVVYGGVTPSAHEVTTIELMAASQKSAVVLPSGVAWVQSREVIVMPPGYVGMWIQTNSLSRSGLLLLNSTLVEPGYRGNLAAHFVNFGASPVSISSNTTIAKLVFVALDRSASELIDSKPYKDYNALIDGLAAKSAPSFLRIGELVPDLGRAADSLVAKARTEIAAESTAAIERTRETFTSLGWKTFFKLGGGFVVGLGLAIAFSLAIFPYIRGVDIESTDRMTSIVKEQNAALSAEIEALRLEIAGIRARQQSEMSVQPRGGSATSAQKDAGG